MNLTELSVRRPVTGVMVFLALTILGVFTFSRLKLDMLPNIEFPIVAVLTTYNGAGPDAIEQLVTRPIEEAMSSVQSVEDVTSTSSQNTSVVMVKFAWGTDMDKAEQDVRRNLEMYAKDVLPDDITRSLTFAFDPSLQPVVFLSVNSQGTQGTARQIAEDVVKPFLGRIPGVAAAEVMGGSKREIQVRLRPEWLQAYRVPAGQVVQALGGANLMMPGGRLEQGSQELNISTNSEFTSVDQIRNVVVGSREGVPVLLADVADVVDSFEESTSVVRSDGSAAVMMAVRKQSDANTVQVARRVMNEVKKLSARLPEGTTVTTLFDQAQPITRSISNLSSTGAIAIVLTALVLLTFLRSGRTSAIVLVSIPLSLLVTFAVMDSQDVTLNIISMAGLALAVGMLVDNSIVVLENIFTHMERGKDRKQAAIDGTKEVAMPITAATLTTVAVFAPVLFVPGLAGQLFRDMSLTICFSLVASLVVALTLVPLMASLLLRRGGPGRFGRMMGVLTFWLDPLTRSYGSFLGSALGHRKKVILGAMAVFIGSLMVAPLLGVDFMPRADDGMLQLDVKAQPGNSLATTEEIFGRIEQIVSEEVPEAEVIVSEFGGGDGFGALIGQNAHSGTVRVRLPPVSERDRGVVEIENVLRRRFADLSGVEVKPGNAGAGLIGGSGDIALKLFGENLVEVQDYGQRLTERLERIDGIGDVVFSMKQGQPELRVDIDRDQLRLLGLSAADVASTVTTYFLGTRATVFREKGDEHPITVRAPREIREDIERLRGLPLITPAGVVVPLETAASLRPGLGPTSITRENQKRLATIAITSGGIPLGALVSRVEAALQDTPPPSSITTMVAGTAEDLKESFAALGLAFLVAVLLVYMVMASQFESLLEPFVIIFTVPLAISGVIFALALTNTTLQVTALIGIILLAGVVVNNGIVLIDVLKNRRAEGQDLVAAAVEAGRSRLRPILMTTATTVLGMFPLAMEIGDGAEMWAPMARAVIGGMLLSTGLTLVVIPTAYVMMAGWIDGRRARRQAQAATGPREDEAIRSAA